MKNLFLISCLLSLGVMIAKLIMFPDLSWLWVTVPFWGWLLIASIPLAALIITIYLTMAFLIISGILHFVVNYKGVK